MARADRTVLEQHADALRAALAAVRRELEQAHAANRFRAVAQALAGEVDSALSAGRPGPGWDRSGGWFLSPTRMTEHAQRDEEALTDALVEMCHAAARWRRASSG